MKNYEIPITKWLYLISGLRKRGQGLRESGAFLLHKADKIRINKIIFYDQLDPEVSKTGIIRFNGSGYVKLWNLLKDLKMEVAADIHTHPDYNTNQSYADQRHPMVRLQGHVAMIAPNFALNRWLTPGDCSSYIYQGNFNWKKAHSYGISCSLP